MGTSAGAIVAAMLAANVDVEALRVELLKGLRNNLLDEVKDVGKWSFLMSAGNPVWKTDALRHILVTTFKKKNIQKLGDIEKIDLRIVATDLVHQIPIVYSSQDPRHRDLDLVDALLDSCAIPFYFRGWKQGNIVDGGIVLNFPCKDLLAFEKKDGKVFGLSFLQKDRPAPRNALDFGLALLDAAMENATREAAETLERRVLRLPNDFGTLSFKEAFSDHGLGDHFKLSKSETLRWFKDRIANPRIFIDEDFWSGQSTETMAALVKMYRVQAKHCQLLYNKATMEVTAYGLLDSEKPDRTVTRMIFHTTDQVMYGHSVSLSETSTVSDLKSSNIHLSNEGKQIKIDILPMIDGGQRKEVLVVFEEPLPPNSGPYTLEIIDSVLGLTKVLSDKGIDEIVSWTDRSRLPIALFEVVVHLPETMRDTQRLSPLKIKGAVGVEFDPPWNDYPSPAEFFAVGWQGKNVPPGQDFGFLLSVPKAEV